MELSRISTAILRERLISVGFDEGGELVTALEDVEKSLEHLDRDVGYFEYQNGKDCSVYSDEGDQKHQRITTLGWGRDCEGLKKRLVLAVGEYMDDVVYLIEQGEDPSDWGAHITLAGDPPALDGVVSFTFLIAAYHGIDVHESAPELMLAERLRGVTVARRIEAGDTLSAIAHEIVGIAGDVSVISDLNPSSISNVDFIRAGETVSVPPAINTWAVHVTSSSSPAEVSQEIYGTSHFALLMSVLCSEGGGPAKRRCTYPVWQDATAVAEAVEAAARLRWFFPEGFSVRVYE